MTRSVPQLPPRPHLLSKKLGVFEQYINVSVLFRYVIDHHVSSFMLGDPYQRPRNLNPVDHFQRNYSS